MRRKVLEGNCYIPYKLIRSLTNPQNNQSTNKVDNKRRAEKEAEKHHRKPEISKNSQNNIMQIYMMVMILFFGMTLPSAMSLYWAINSLVNIVKTLVVQIVIDKSDLKEGRAR